MKQSLKLVVFSMLLSCSQFALAQSAEDAHEEILAYTIDGIVEHYPAGSIQSTEQADVALADAKESRTKLEQRFEAEQQLCYPKFFTTACLNKATERKRLDLQVVKKIEVEANAYIRHARVEKRDRKLEEKARERAEKNKVDPILTTPKPEESATTAAPAAETVDPARRDKADAYAKKVADHEKRLQQIEQEQQAGAAERAANVEKYEAKQKEAAERQRKVAERKAEKEKAEAAKQAKAAAEANRPPPTPGE
ncbi:hypothetical protein [Oxalicibacterium solurbis]|uniref:TolA protein n=1 Tax=Oxalicibacterium solurbis TaxID=69280 RepID=A0A8J3AXP7_9BURK|nr:hypothetical protein [Oxalicibacterium solurbis]GGI52962.1 hypothetical protein GCM10011430_01360 [Oxalicibacterium solurbis]